MKRFNLLLLCLLIVAGAFAQEKKRKPSAYNKQKQSQEDEKFLEKQWWLGFKAGANLSKANVEKTYSIVSDFYLQVIRFIIEGQPNPRCLGMFHYVVKRFLDNSE